MGQNIWTKFYNFIITFLFHTFIILASDYINTASSVNHKMWKLIVDRYQVQIFWETEKNTYNHITFLEVQVIR